MAAAIMRAPSLPGNVTLTLIARVNIWPKENIQMIHEKSAIPLPEKSVIQLANKFSNIDKNGKIYQEPLSVDELLRWSSKWEVRNQNVLEPWLKHLQPNIITADEFSNRWVQSGGEKLPKQFLDKYFDK